MRTRNNNGVAIQGYLGADPEIKETDKATLAKFSVGIPMGKDVTTWVYVTAWHNDARMCSDLLKKGTEVIVQGELQVREYEGKSYTSINATGVHPLVKIEWSRYIKDPRPKKEEVKAPPSFDIPDTEYRF